MSSFRARSTSTVKWKRSAQGLSSVGSAIPNGRLFDSEQEFPSGPKSVRLQKKRPFGIAETGVRDQGNCCSVSEETSVRDGQDSARVRRKLFLDSLPSFR